MSRAEIIETTFQEALYAIPPKPVVAIATSWDALTENEKGLLDKILGSVKLSLNHITVISTTQLEVLKWPNKPGQVLAFGLDLKGFTHYEPFQVHDITVILAPGLSALESDKEGKQKLWAGLKKVFVQ